MNLDDAGALDHAEKLFARRRLDVSSTFRGMGRIDGDLDPEGTAVVLTALGACTDPAGRAADDSRTPGQCRADAMVQICSFYLGHGDTPHSGGEKPHVSVIVELETLERRAGGSCELEGVAVIYPETARRLACDAAVSRIITRGCSEPLDVGRRTPSVPAAIRRALAVRDQGCVFAGCDRPVRWCDAHHIKHWADGGDTSLDNLVLLCRRHHHMVHEGRVALPP